MMNERELLSEWKVSAELPGNFNSAVWRRIEARAQSGPGEVIGTWLMALFAKPAIAATYSLVALGIGLMAGNLHGANAAEKQQSEMEIRYIQSVDPYSNPAAK